MALIVGGAGLALAQEATVVAPSLSDALVQRVNYKDLNLVSPSGRRHLHFRVGYAVEQVCPSFLGLEGDISQRRCMIGAWAKAQPQMDLAFARAQQIASTGKSSIAPVAIAIIAPATR